MSKNWHNPIAIVLSVVLGTGLLFLGTDGFQAFTAESARILNLMEEEPFFPEVILEDSKDSVYSFSVFEGKYVLLTFIYTACSDVCPQLEMNLAEVYNQVPSKYIGEEIVFLSISFDPSRDDPETLEKYRAYFGSDGETWRMARISDQTELEDLLEAFGVVVIPDGKGNFTHNSAFYLVNRAGKLEKVMDYTKINEAADTIVSMLENELEE